MSPQRLNMKLDDRWYYCRFFGLKVEFGRLTQPELPSTYLLPKILRLVLRNGVNSPRAHQQSLH